MKKFSAFIISLTLIISLASCGNFSTSSEDATEQSTEQIAELTLGAIENNVYTNEFIGLGVNLPSDWFFYSDEQIAEINGLAKDMLSEDIAAQIEASGAIYAMYAGDSYGNNININIEDLKMYGTLSEEDYVNTAYEQIPPAFEQIGATDISCTVTSTKLGDDTHASFDTSMKLGESFMYQKVVCAKVDKYMCNITITGFDQATVDNLVSLFYSL